MKPSIISITFASVLTFSVNAQEAITFGVVPQQSASKLATQWLPIMEYLATESNVSIRFATKPSIPEFEVELGKQSYDIAYMNPYHYTVFSQNNGYRAIAKAQDKMIRGIVVVRKDSGIEDMSELSDTSMAFPSPAAFAATILPRAFLKLSDITVTPTYVRSHDSVYLNVAKGLFPAGGGVMRTYRAMEPSITEQLKILWESDGYTPHAIAVSSSMPEETKRKLQHALLTLSQDKPELLSPLRIKGFVAANDHDWDDVRGLSIDVNLKAE